MTWGWGLRTPDNGSSVSGGAGLWGDHNSGSGSSAPEAWSVSDARGVSYPAMVTQDLPDTRVAAMGAAIVYLLIAWSNGVFLQSVFR